MKRQIEIKIGDEVFRLVPNFEAMSILEDSIGTSLLQMSNEVTSGRPRLSLLCRIIYAGVRAGRNPKWTEDALGNFLLERKFYRDQDVLKGVVDFLSELLAAGDDSEDEKKSGEEQPSPSTSSSSQPNPTG